MGDTSRYENHRLKAKPPGRSPSQQAVGWMIRRTDPMALNPIPPYTV